LSENRTLSNRLKLSVRVDYDSQAPMSELVREDLTSFGGVELAHSSMLPTIEFDHNSFHDECLKIDLVESPQAERGENDSLV
jgi:hypothetical protein